MLIIHNEHDAFFCSLTSTGVPRRDGTSDRRFTDEVLHDNRLRPATAA